MYTCDSLAIHKTFHLFYLLYHSNLSLNDFILLFLLIFLLPAKVLTHQVVPVQVLIHSIILQELPYWTVPHPVQTVILLSVLLILKLPLD